MFGVQPWGSGRNWNGLGRPCSWAVPRGCERFKSKREQPVGKRQKCLLYRIKKELQVELENDFKLTEPSEGPKVKTNYESEHAFLCEVLFCESPQTPTMWIRCLQLLTGSAGPFGCDLEISTIFLPSCHLWFVWTLVTLLSAFYA